MKYCLLLCLFLPILSISCEDLFIPEGYPATYNKLPAGTISDLRSGYLLRNQYVTSSLNDYGFCGYNGDPVAREYPPFTGQVTKEQATGVVMAFISNNKDETGIDDAAEVTFTQSSVMTLPNGVTSWHFRTANQKIDTVEIMYSSIIFNMYNDEVTNCLGNWYPEVYIPEKFNIDEGAAKRILLGRELSHTTIGGDEYQVKITGADLDGSTIHLKIFPKDNDNNIQLRVCWLVDVPGPVYYLIYIDVMTGEIIAQYPTIIS